MYLLGSSTALYSGNEIERAFRDGHAAAQQGLLHATHHELAGRLLLGLEPGAPIF